MDEEIGGVDDELGHSRQFGAHVPEHARKDRHDQPQHQRDGKHGNADENDRIHQGPADFAVGLAGLADLLVEFQEHRPHLAGDFPGANHLDPVVLENLRIGGCRRVQRAAGRDAAGNRVQHTAQFQALALLRGNLDRLQYRRSRADQRGKLLKERHLVVQGDALVRLARYAGTLDEPVFERHFMLSFFVQPRTSDQRFCKSCTRQFRVGRLPDRLLELDADSSAALVGSHIRNPSQDMLDALAVRAFQEERHADQAAAGARDLRVEAHAAQADVEGIRVDGRFPRARPSASPCRKKARVGNAGST